MKQLLMAAILIAQCSQARATTWTFGDWEVACDNVKHCESIGMAPMKGDASNDSRAGLLIVRDAGPNSAVRVTVLIEFDAEGWGHKRVTPVRMFLGSKVLGPMIADRPLSAGFSAALLAELAGAHDATIERGNAKLDLALTGLTETLLKFDEVQGRRDTPGALARQGRRAESTVPVAPTMPVVALASLGNERPVRAGLPIPSEKELASASANDSCGYENPDRQTLAFRVSAKKMLVLHDSCPGSYQSGWSAWIANTRPPFLVREVTDGQNGEMSNLVGSVEPIVVGKERHRSVIVSWRGMAAPALGIGESAKFGWDGKRFIRLEAYCLAGKIVGGFPLRTWITRYGTKPVVPVQRRQPSTSSRVDQSVLADFAFRGSTP